MRLAWFLLASMCVCIPRATAGQDRDFASSVDAVTLAVVQPILDAATRDSLPVQALRSKVLEGLAKNVRPAQIGQVVAALADEFRSARSALRTGLPPLALGDGEVVAAAMAARQEIGFDVVRALLESRPNGGSLEVPVTVLSELVRRGVPVEEAATLMTHVVRTAVPLGLAAQIPGKFDGALGAGRPPAAALVEALRALNIPDPPGRDPPGRDPPGRRPPG